MGLFSHKKKEQVTKIPDSVPPMPKESSEAVVSQAPVPEMKDSQSTNDFALPDLPPMPGKPVDETQSLSDTVSAETDDSSASPFQMAETQQISNDSGELPELPDLPSFDNHPEHDVVENMPTQEEVAQVEAAMPAPKPIAPKPQETFSPNVDSKPAMTFDPSKPIFLDVVNYADMIADINITKADLKHIHDRSGLTAYESQIDETLMKFKNNIMQAKKDLNKVDSLLFAR